MKTKLVPLLVFCFALLISYSAFAQYKGGSYDGYDMEISSYTLSSSSPYIIIDTDKETYSAGDEMTVYADVGNPTDSMISRAWVALYVVGPFGVMPYQQTGPFNMPPDFSVEDFELLAISHIPALIPATYAWLAVLFSESDGYLDHDAAIWSYSTVVSTAEATRLRKTADEYAKTASMDDFQI